ncbi:MAG TPA: type II toxin-antitoxin system RelE/ParE family toxin [Candidatus Nanoarchaeia archaeon]|nr:type II toxin-antitoxin system RelE/ParE family toxin [Candidatus Nanoarchaeia archaeon]
MVVATFHPHFQEIFSKIKDKLLKEKILKQFAKIRENPEIGKPMRFSRKGTREVYVSPFRLSYMYIQGENKIIFLDLYHKDEQ